MGGPRLTPRNCFGCGETFQPRRSSQKFCKIRCVGDYGRQVRIDKSRSTERRYDRFHNFTYVRDSKGEWVAEHRYIFQKHWNVTLPPYVPVTFVDGDRSNLDPSNLKLRSKSMQEYLEKHGKLPPRTKAAIPIRRSARRPLGGGNPEQ